jgi:hypothetical protein
VALGLAMGATARTGRDKLTLILPPILEPFGLWVEQLVAESTGKRGAGVIPIAGESLARPEAYGTDRVFVRIRVHGLAEETPRDRDVQTIRAAGVPVASIDLPEPSALGAEFVRWEIATAVAGAMLGVNPFDEPNVQQAKDATRALLDRYRDAGALPSRPTDRSRPDGTTFTLSAAARDALVDGAPEAVLTLLKEGDYVSVLAYLGPDPALADVLRQCRQTVRNRTKAATMIGYGPRYLHSTGQLHKGGPNSGVFVLVSATPRTDLPIPAEPYSFAVLELAQAQGDFHSLDQAGRRALHVHLAAPERGLLQSALDALLERLPQRSG